ncbi:MAG: transcriptional regulator, TetR family [Agromyces sp.]|jgi:AcrR family transcriptional regulator|nr:transcriptional regulator, TetR family [Agromyces sp.]
MSTVVADEDLSARGRIVAAAMELFALHGFQGATVRAVAASAGVSPALVIHHFGGKDGLRRECDERVVRFVAAKRLADADADVLGEATRRFGPYLTRMLSDPGDAADAMFDLLLGIARSEVTEGIRAGTMLPSSDREAQAAALVILSVAPFFLANQLARWSGADAAAGIGRLSGPLSEIYARGLLVAQPREQSR